MKGFYYGSELLFFAVQAWFVLQLTDGLFSSAWQGRRKRLGEAALIGLTAVARLSASLWGGGLDSFLVSDVIGMATILIMTVGTVVFYLCSPADAFGLNMLGWGSLILGDYLARTFFLLLGNPSELLSLPVDARGACYFLVWAVGMIPAGTGLKRWIAGRKRELLKYRKPWLILAVPMLPSILCFQVFPSQKLGRWAGFLLCCFLLFLAGLLVLLKQEADLSVKIQELKSSMLERQYQQLFAAYNERMILVHDMKNHMRVIGAMLEQGKSEDASAYVARIAGKLADSKGAVWSNHEAMNLVLSTKFQEAGSAQVQVDCHCDDMSGLALSFPEVCALFSNLLDNAIEAAGKCPAGGRWLRLQCARRERMLMVSLSNSVPAGKAVPEKLPFGTAKADKEFHGFGMCSIQKVLEDYGGNMRTNRKEGEFSIVIYLTAFGDKEG